MARTQTYRTTPVKMPGFTCCVEGCRNNSARDRQFRFYVFPSEPKLRSIWLHNLANAGSKRFGSFQPTSGHRVCSAHFQGGRKTYMIRIPTIFPLLGSTDDRPLSTGIIQHATEITGCVRGEISRQIFGPTKRGRRELWDHSYSCGSADSEKLVQLLQEKNKTIAEMEVLISDLQSQLGQAASKVQRLEKELQRVSKNMKEDEKRLTCDILQSSC